MNHKPIASVRKTVIMCVISVLGLALLGAGCRNPFRQEPAEVLRRAQERWVNSSGVRFKAQLTLDTEYSIAGERRESGKIALEATGAQSGNGPDDSRADMTVTATFDTPSAAGRLVLDDRTIGQTAYLRLRDATFAPKGRGTSAQSEADAVLGAVKAAIGGKWVRLDPAAARTIAAQVGAAIPTEAELRGLEEEARVRDAAVRAALAQHQLFAIRDDLGDARVGKKKAYHYRVGVNADSLIAILNQLGSSFGVNAGQLAMARSAMQDPAVSDFFEKTNGEVWIAKEELDILRLAVPVAVRREDGETRGQFTADFSEWGKPLTVAAPTDAVPIQELLGLFFGGAGARSAPVPIGSDEATP